MREAEVLECQIQTWYPRFRRVSLRTRIHVLPEAFVNYLLEDGLFLSRSSEAMPTRTTVTCPELQSEDYDRWEEEDDDEGEPEVPSFLELERDVKASIEKLGGAVFPKLNWTAPKDTTWISTSGNLKCHNFGEILLLLKASDSVTHDLCSAFDSCEDKSKDRPDVVVLALRKWYELRPELEFRAFVRGGVLVGICQREVTGFYPSLVGAEADYEFAIFDFFHEEIRGKFPAPNFTFDCYVTKDSRVKLLDFNPWGGSTLPLLFTWEQLEENHAKLTGDGKLTTQINEANGSAALSRDVAFRLNLKTNEMTIVGEEKPGISVDCREEKLTGVSLASSAGHWSNGESGIDGDRSSPSADFGSVCPVSRDSETRESPMEAAFCDVQYRVEVRIVTSEGLVQPGLRIGTGIPIDFINRENWEEVIRKEAADEAYRERIAAGD